MGVAHVKHVFLVQDVQYVQNVLLIRRKTDGE